jgi:hypothetical protein
MEPEAALAFVEQQGVVLESGRGSVANLAEWIAGEPIRGSWWGHRRSHEIFAVTRALRRSPDVLVCRLVDGKITYVHRRLWAALVGASDLLPRDRLAAITEIHTPEGRHEVKETPFPEWVPETVVREAKAVSPSSAAQTLAEITGMDELR